MLQTCPECKSHDISDKTANKLFVIIAILAVIGTILVFFAWGWSFLVITGMLTCVVLTVELRRRLFKCKDCGHSWKGDYAPSGEKTDVPIEKEVTSKATA